MWIYIAHCHKVSNALGTLVPAEKPSLQTVSEGLIVLLCTEVVQQGVPDHRAVHSECSSANCRHPMSRHYHQLLCGWPETLPNIAVSCESPGHYMKSHATWDHSVTCHPSWWHSTVARTSVLAGELSLSHARPSADGWPLMWVNRPLEVSQQGQLSLSFPWGR